MKRKDISELNITSARECMRAYGMDDFVVHAPYIINLANTVNPATYEIAVEFLALEIERTVAMGSHTLILHPVSRRPEQNGSSLQGRDCHIEVTGLVSLVGIALHRTVQMQLIFFCFRNLYL